MRPVIAACGLFSVIQENSSTNLIQISNLSVMQSCVSSAATKYIHKYHKPTFIFEPSSAKKAVDSSKLLLFVL